MEAETMVPEIYHQKKNEMDLTHEESAGDKFHETLSESRSLVTKQNEDQKIKDLPPSRSDAIKLAIVEKTAEKISSLEVVEVETDNFVAAEPVINTEVLGKGEEKHFEGQHFYETPSKEQVVSVVGTDEYDPPESQDANLEEIKEEEICASILATTREIPRTEVQIQTDQKEHGVEISETSADGLPQNAQTQSEDLSSLLIKDTSAKRDLWATAEDDSLMKASDLTYGNQSDSEIRKEEDQKEMEGKEISSLTLQQDSVPPMNSPNSKKKSDEFEKYSAVETLHKIGQMNLQDEKPEDVGLSLPSTIAEATLQEHNDHRETSLVSENPIPEKHDERENIDIEDTYSSKNLMWVSQEKHELEGNETDKASDQRVADKKMEKPTEGLREKQIFEALQDGLNEEKSEDREFKTTCGSVSEEANVDLVNQGKILSEEIRITRERGNEKLNIPFCTKNKERSSLNAEGGEYSEQPHYSSSEYLGFKNIANLENMTDRKSRSASDTGENKGTYESEEASVAHSSSRLNSTKEFLLKKDQIHETGAEICDVAEELKKDLQKSDKETDDFFLQQPSADTNLQKISIQGKEFEKALEVECIEEYVRMDGVDKSLNEEQVQSFKDKTASESTGPPSTEETDAQKTGVTRKNNVEASEFAHELMPQTQDTIQSVAQNEKSSEDVTETLKPEIAYDQHIARGLEIVKERTNNNMDIEYVEDTTRDSVEQKEATFVEIVETICSAPKNENTQADEMREKEDLTEEDASQQVIDEENLKKNGIACKGIPSESASEDTAESSKKDILLANDEVIESITENDEKESELEKRIQNLDAEQALEMVSSRDGSLEQNLRPSETVLSNSSNVGNEAHDEITDSSSTIQSLTREMVDKAKQEELDEDFVLVPNEKPQETISTPNSTSMKDEVVEEDENQGNNQDASHAILPTQGTPSQQEEVESKKHDNNPKAATEEQTQTTTDDGYICKESSLQNEDENATVTQASLEENLHEVERVDDSPISQASTGNNSHKDGTSCQKHEEISNFMSDQNNLEVANEKPKNTQDIESVKDTIEDSVDLLETTFIEGPVETISSIAKESDPGVDDMREDKALTKQGMSEQAIDEENLEKGGITYKEIPNEPVTQNTEESFENVILPDKEQTVENVSENDEKDNNLPERIQNLDTKQALEIISHDGSLEQNLQSSETELISSYKDAGNKAHEEIAITPSTSQSSTREMVDKAKQEEIDQHFVLISNEKSQETIPRPTSTSVKDEVVEGSDNQKNDQDVSYATLPTEQAPSQPEVESKKLDNIPKAASEEQNQTTTDDGYICKETSLQNEDKNVIVTRASLERIPHEVERIDGSPVSQAFMGNDLHEEAKSFQMHEDISNFMCDKNYLKMANEGAKNNLDIESVQDTTEDSVEQKETTFVEEPVETISSVPKESDPGADDMRGNKAHTKQSTAEQATDEENLKKEGIACKEIPNEPVSQGSEEGSENINLPANEGAVENFRENDEQDGDSLDRIQNFDAEQALEMTSLSDGSAKKNQPLETELWNNYRNADNEADEENTVTSSTIQASTREKVEKVKQEEFGKHSLTVSNEKAPETILGTTSESMKDTVIESNEKQGNKQYASCVTLEKEEAPLHQEEVESKKLDNDPKAAIENQNTPDEGRTYKEISLQNEYENISASQVSFEESLSEAEKVDSNPGLEASVGNNFQKYGTSHQMHEEISDFMSEKENLENVDQSETPADEVTGEEGDTDYNNHGGHIKQQDDEESTQKAERNSSSFEEERVDKEPDERNKTAYRENNDEINNTQDASTQQETSCSAFQYSVQEAEKVKAVAEPVFVDQSYEIDVTCHAKNEKTEIIYDNALIARETIESSTRNEVMEGFKQEKTLKLGTEEWNLQEKSISEESTEQKLDLSIIQQRQELLEQASSINDDNTEEGKSLNDTTACMSQICQDSNDEAAGTDELGGDGNYNDPSKYLDGEAQEITFPSSNKEELKHHSRKEKEMDENIWHISVTGAQTTHLEVAEGEEPQDANESDSEEQQHETNTKTIEIQILTEGSTEKKKLESLDIAQQPMEGFMQKEDEKIDEASGMTSEEQAQEHISIREKIEDEIYQYEQRTALPFVPETVEEHEAKEDKIVFSIEKRETELPEDENSGNRSLDHLPNDEDSITEIRENKTDEKLIKMETTGSSIRGIPPVESNKEENSFLEMVQTKDTVNLVKKEDVDTSIPSATIEKLVEDCKWEIKVKISEDLHSVQDIPQLEVNKQEDLIEGVTQIENREKYAQKETKDISSTGHDSIGEILQDPMKLEYCSNQEPEKDIPKETTATVQGNSEVTVEKKKDSILELTHKESIEKQVEKKNTSGFPYVIQDSVEETSEEYVEKIAEACDQGLQEQILEQTTSVKDIPQVEAKMQEDSFEVQEESSEVFIKKKIDISSANHDALGVISQEHEKKPAASANLELQLEISTQIVHNLQELEENMQEDASEHILHNKGSKELGVSAAIQDSIPESMQEELKIQKAIPEETTATEDIHVENGRHQNAVNEILEEENTQNIVEKTTVDACISSATPASGEDFLQKCMEKQSQSSNLKLQEQIPEEKPSAEEISQVEIKNQRNLIKEMLQKQDDDTISFASREMVGEALEEHVGLVEEDSKQEFRMPPIQSILQTADEKHESSAPNMEVHNNLEHANQQNEGLQICFMSEIEEKSINGEKAQMDHEEHIKSPELEAEEEMSEIINASRGTEIEERQGGESSLSATQASTYASIKVNETESEVKRKVLKADLLEQNLQPTEDNENHDQKILKHGLIPENVQKESTPNDKSEREEFKGQASDQVKLGTSESSDKIKEVEINNFTFLESEERKDEILKESETREIKMTTSNNKPGEVIEQDLDVEILPDDKKIEEPLSTSKEKISKTVDSLEMFVNQAKLETGASVGKTEEEKLNSFMLVCEEQNYEILDSSSDRQNEIIDSKKNIDEVILVQNSVVEISSEDKKIKVASKSVLEDQNHEILEFDEKYNESFENDATSKSLKQETTVLVGDPEFAIKDLPILVKGEKTQEQSKSLKLDVEDKTSQTTMCSRNTEIEAQKEAEKNLLATQASFNAGPKVDETELEVQQNVHKADSKGQSFKAINDNESHDENTLKEELTPESIEDESMQHETSKGEEFEGPAPDQVKLERSLSHDKIEEKKINSVSILVPVEPKDEFLEAGENKEIRMTRANYKPDEVLRQDSTLENLLEDKKIEEPLSAAEKKILKYTSIDSLDICADQAQLETGASLAKTEEENADRSNLVDEEPSCEILDTGYGKEVETTDSKEKTNEIILSQNSEVEISSEDKKVEVESQSVLEEQNPEILKADKKGHENFKNDTPLASLKQETVVLRGELDSEVEDQQLLQVPTLVQDKNIQEQSRSLEQDAEEETSEITKTSRNTEIEAQKEERIDQLATQVSSDAGLELDELEMQVQEKVLKADPKGQTFQTTDDSEHCEQKILEESLTPENVETKSTVNDTSDREDFEEHAADQVELEQSQTEKELQPQVREVMEEAELEQQKEQIEAERTECKIEAQPEAEIALKEAQLEVELEDKGEHEAEATKEAQIEQLNFERNKVELPQEKQEVETKEARDYIESIVEVMSKEGGRNLDQASSSMSKEQIHLIIDAKEHKISKHNEMPALISLAQEETEKVQDSGNELQRKDLDNANLIEEETQNASGARKSLDIGCQNDENPDSRLKVMPVVQASIKEILKEELEGRPAGTFNQVFEEETHEPTGANDGANIKSNIRKEKDSSDWQPEEDQIDIQGLKKDIPEIQRLENLPEVAVDKQVVDMVGPSFNEKAMKVKDGESNVERDLDMEMLANSSCAEKVTDARLETGEQNQERTKVNNHVKRMSIKDEESYNLLFASEPTTESGTNTDKINEMLQEGPLLISEEYSREKIEVSKKVEIQDFQNNKALHTSVMQSPAQETLKTETEKVQEVSDLVTELQHHVKEKTNPEYDILMDNESQNVSSIMQATTQKNNQEAEAKDVSSLEVMNLPAEIQRLQLIDGEPLDSTIPKEEKTSDDNFYVSSLMHASIDKSNLKDAKDEVLSGVQLESEIPSHRSIYESEHVKAGVQDEINLQMDNVISVEKEKIVGEEFERHSEELTKCLEMVDANQKLNSKSQITAETQYKQSNVPPAIGIKMSSQTADEIKEGKLQTSPDLPYDENIEETPGVDKSFRANILQKEENAVEQQDLVKEMVEITEKEDAPEGKKPEEASPTIVDGTGIESEQTKATTKVLEIAGNVSGQSQTLDLRKTSAEENMQMGEPFMEGKHSAVDNSSGDKAIFQTDFAHTDKSTEAEKKYVESGFEAPTMVEDSVETKASADIEHDSPDHKNDFVQKDFAHPQEKAEGRDEEENKHEESGPDAQVLSESSKNTELKPAHKKHNILSSVGSKVKHSIGKVKKAITGKSSQHKPHSPKE